MASGVDLLVHNLLTDYGISIPHTQVADSQIRVQSFKLFIFSCYLAILMLGTWVSLHYNIHKNRVKLVSFQLSNHM